MLKKRDLLAAVAERIQRAWTEFRTVGSPQSVKLGSEPAAFELEYGVNPSGVKSFAAIYAITSGPTGFVMTQTGRVDGFAALGSQLDGIAASFVGLARERSTAAITSYSKSSWVPKHRS